MTAGTEEAAGMAAGWLSNVRELARRYEGEGLINKGVADAFGQVAVGCHVLIRGADGKLLPCWCGADHAGEVTAR